MRWICATLICLGLSGCDLPRLWPGTGAEPGETTEAGLEPVAPADISPPVIDGQSPAALDTTAPEERAAAAVPASGGAALGGTVASLGDPARPGFWLETPLVTEEATGRVEYAGQSAQVTLIPAGGPPTAGSRMSLSAMRLLGAPLTDLVEVNVFVLG